MVHDKRLLVLTRNRVIVGAIASCVVVLVLAVLSFQQLSAEQQFYLAISHMLVAVIMALLLLGLGVLLAHELEHAEHTEKELARALASLDASESERHHLETRFLRIQAALDDSGDAVAILDCDHTVTYMNVIFGKTFQHTTDSIAEAGIESIFKTPEQALEIFDEAIEGTNQTTEVELITGQDHHFTALLRAAVILDDEFDIQGVLFIFTDITEQKEIENELRRMAALDGLTQIPNRRVFDSTLEQEWRRAQRDQKMLSLLMIDIDHFKLFNDNYGHQEGDDCLKQVAAALQSGVMRGGDIVTRYGGEEFTVILPDTPIEGAVTVAENLRKKIESLNIPHEFAPVVKQISLSIGVSCMIPDKEHQHDELVTRADSALYAAKNSGRNCVRIYTLDIPG